jgi:hypothetical protein
MLLIKIIIKADIPPEITSISGGKGGIFRIARSYLKIW